MTQTQPLVLGVPLAKARVICVFVHGRGQSPEAMEQAVIRHLSAPGVAYVLPRAPGGSWYDARAVDALSGATRVALARSLALLGSVIAGARAAAPGVPVLLAGFSQGACLSLEYALSQGPWTGALAALTGCRVGQAGDDRPAIDLGGLPVYLTGGDADPWIPVQAFADAAAGLATARARLRADVFPGRGHEVSASELAVLDGMLRDLAQRRPVRLERAG